MKTVSIISSGSIKEVHGANYVLNNFLVGSKFFKHIRLRAIYSSAEELIVNEGTVLPIGEGVGTESYNRVRKVRSVLRNLFSSKYFVGAYIKEYFNFKKRAKKVAEKIRLNCQNDDVLLFQDIYAAYYYFKYVKFENVKTVMIVHQEDDSMSQLFLTFPYFDVSSRRGHFYKLRDFVYDQLDALIYISEKAEKNSIVSESKRRMIYNGIPTIDNSLLSTYVVKDSLNLVCVGSMSGRKGQDLVIEALSLLPKAILDKVKLYLIGDGGERNNLEKMSKNLGVEDNVIFTGVRNDVEKILSDMDIFIMPSLSEGLSISSLEALRAGVYLMMTDTGGNYEVMGENCGVIIERNPKDISQKLENIINKGVICSNQKLCSAERFKRYFSLETMARKYDKILSQL